jgi:hypothetical protein
VRIWNADGTGQPIVLRGHAGVVSSVAFSRDGERVVTTSFDQTVRLWADLEPLPGPAEPATWALSTYCMPAERRVALLHASEADARAQAEACERHVKASGPAPGAARERLERCLRCPRLPEGRGAAGRAGRASSGGRRAGAGDAKTAP